MRTKLALRLFCLVSLVAGPMFFASTASRAQVRGVYPVGMNATNSGVTPETGITYSNLFVFFSRDEKRDSEGNVVATGRNSIMMDLNSFVWVSKGKIGLLGGAVLSASATLPVANNSLTSDLVGPLSGGGGFADSFYQPLILGWRKRRTDIRAIYGFLAPTGKFEADGNNNVGSGYWTSVLSSGQTIYLTESKATALSAFEMYEFHGTQQGTMSHPGQTFNLDYSLTQAFSLQGNLRLQVGLAGYGQWQTTDKQGPAITREEAAAHYKVNSLGFTTNAIFPGRKASVGVKYFHEFACRSTYQGYTLQISGAITF